MGLRQTREAETVQWNDPKGVTSLVVDYFWRETVAEVEKVESLHPCITLQRDATDCVSPTAAFRSGMEARRITLVMIQVNFPALC